MNTKAEETLAQHWVIEFLAQPRLARMATCDPHTLQPHVVPVWFGWDGKYLWISSFRSTRKIRELEANPRLSVVIDEGDGDAPTRGVILEGPVELVHDPEIVRTGALSIYTRYLGENGVLEAEPQSWLNDPENLLIKLRPEKAFAWGG